MVTSINPSNVGAGAFNVDTRVSRPQAQPQREQNGVGDRVEIAGASLNAARDSVRDGLMQVHQALALGHDAQAMLLQVQTLARSGGDTVQAELSALLSGFAERVQAAISDGASLAAGEDLAVQAEPGAAQGAAGIRHDIDADGARLLALQVRQGLEGVGGAAIANVEPQAVLSLFRA